MVKKNRDEFTAVIKRTLAERVGWKCSFPGCGQSTIGPDSCNPAKSVRVGVAAHIHAAAPQGARYKERMSREERRDISNGIWMCQHHGNLIDADYREYSPDTLRDWKRRAERSAAEALKNLDGENFPDGSTLVQLGSGDVFQATWEQAGPTRWSFRLKRHEIGSLDSLRDHVSSLNSLSGSERFIVGYL